MTISKCRERKQFCAGKRRRSEAKSGKVEEGTGREGMYMYIYVYEGIEGTEGKKGRDIKYGK